MSTSLDIEKKRRDMTVTAIGRLNQMLADGTTASRAELLDDGTVSTKNWATAVLKMLRRGDYIKPIGIGAKTRYQILKPLPVNNEAFIQACVSPYAYAWTDAELPTFEAPRFRLFRSRPPSEFQERVRSIKEIVEPDKVDEVKPEAETESDAAVATEPPADPIMLLLSLPTAVHRIEDRMTLIEHRLMDIAEKVEGLHNEWTGNKA